MASQWQIYHRADEFRLGRKRWWGVQWYKFYNQLGWSYARYPTVDAARYDKNRLNKREINRTKFREDRWKVVE